jgi:hypothetical protein
LNQQPPSIVSSPRVTFQHNKPHNLPLTPNYNEAVFLPLLVEDVASGYYTLNIGASSEDFRRHSLSSRDPGANFSHNQTHTDCG